MLVTTNHTITRQGQDEPLEFRLEITAEMYPGRPPYSTSNRASSGFSDIGEDPEVEILSIATDTDIPVPVEHLTAAEVREIEESLWYALRSGIGVTV